MVCSKEKINIVLLLLFLLLPVSSFSQVLEHAKLRIAERKESYNKKMNFGFKVGFRSSDFIGNKLQIEGQTIDNLQNNYKMGYYASAFSRINFRRRYLQMEISCNSNSAEIVFNNTAGTTSSKTTSKATISSTVYSLGFPLLYGYYIVRNGPYTMSVFGGPKLKYVFNSNIEYNNFTQQNIHESFHPFNLAAMSGVSVSISRVFFDFRYEQEILNASRKISYTPSSLDNNNATGDISYHRRESCLSFSLGILF
jgi:hypothetical protein